ncbi:MAG TPA: hypothetical protein VGE14_15565 [Marmoricola sp.]
MARAGSRPGTISRDELAEVITDAWCSCAPTTPVNQFRAEG